MPNAARWLVLLVVLLTGCTTTPSPTPPPAAQAPTSTAPGAGPASSPTGPSPAPLQSPPPSPSPSPSPTPRTTVRLGVQTSLGAWVLDVADQQGFVAAQGLALDRKLADASADAVAKDVDGRERDVGVVATDHLIQFGRNGQSLVMVGGLVNKVTYSLVAARDVPDLAALKGRAIGIRDLSTGAAAVLRELLRARGILERDVEVITFLDPGVVGAAVANGTVGASLVDPPRAARLKAGGFKALVEASDVVKDFQSEGLVVRPDWARQNEETLVRLLRATIQAQRWIATPANKPAAVESLARSLGITGPEATAVYEQYVEKLGAIPREVDIDQAGVRGVADLLAGINALPTPRPDPARLTDTSFQQRAKASVPR